MAGFHATRHDISVRVGDWLNHDRLSDIVDKLMVHDS